ncbi:anhydro-N-acetylmuramic acid kinase [Sulfurivirga caldicuralii]|uniref:Anhydro-N-acetylmuramic acid kinase n=1 Tax=Sulfurivirga caldicuralii TaxID=364032 RepID=A0A1N6GLE4_9GAMM|nr:anhydro-N-acetylmuramic acid kinase [Sulfurivirga caldicuralii]SIO08311.1 anhydro-N-acetylmuramic acid kinase [Sulfurivirga caldicuralii]
MNVLGVLSGTSADGIDLGLCRIEAGRPIYLTAFETFPFPAALQDKLRHLPGRSAPLAQLATLQNQLDAAFAQAVNRFRAQHRDPVELIGFHGQTLWHDPRHGSSWALGSAAALAARTGVPVVAGFRDSDLALGGQGAPLAPLFHAELFAHLPKPAALVNIGGIANVTLLLPDGRIQGWDTGPGNGIIDELMQHHFGQPFDQDGATAARGRVNDGLLATLLRHPYFSEAPPKSTGREQFNRAWFARLQDTPLAPEDQVATAAALTVETIARALASVGAKTVVLMGGGAHNTTLQALLQAHLPEAEFFDLKKVGDPPVDAIEAMLFAWLAWKRWHNEAVDYTAITGAARPGLYGSVWQA